ncbi:MAG TPA: response regulator [Chloroflexia bacterium]|nr:response regulator [Chloroflexia bacterium]
MMRGTVDSMPAAQPVDGAPGPARLVLIVEDEPDNREIIRSVVEDIMGHAAALAADGEDALAAIGETAPDLILMDLMMPILNGFEAIRALKNDPATASIPVIAVSALSRARDQQQALDVGADDYISKPFDLDLLANKITALLPPR